jgi:hypothetical protein
MSVNYTHRPDNGSIKHLRNVGQFLQAYTAQHPIFIPEVQSLLGCTAVFSNSELHTRCRENLKSHILIPVTMRTLNFTETDTLYTCTEVGLDVITQGIAAVYYKET